MPRWLTKDEQRAWRGLLHMTAQLEVRVNRQLQQASGLSQADYYVLAPLSESPDGRLRVYEVGQALGWEQSRLSHHLSRMQTRGLIERRECESDRRGAFVVLTSAGREAIEKAAPAHVATVRALVFDGLSRDQVRVLGEIAETVLARLDEPQGPPARP
ncbi:MAG TPA: MarR family transcriptional regulator [Mycobacteriales bacterium]|nr:MarR family transcriptional regulator [Mycobacteriales bacterium]